MSRRRSVAAALVALALTALTLSSASADELVGTPATETLFISSACTPIAPTVCSGSSNWLGKEPGTSISGEWPWVYPHGEVLYQVNGEPAWRSYSSDDSLRWGGYPLRSDEPIRMTLTVTARGVAANATVHGRLYGYPAGERIELGDGQDVVTVLPGGRETVTLEFDVPDTLDGVVIQRLLAKVAVHGLNVEGGFLDQQGGSTVTIPYYEDSASQG